DGVRSFSISQGTSEGRSTFKLLDYSRLGRCVYTHASAWIRFRSGAATGRYAYSEVDAGVSGEVFQANGGSEERHRVGSDLDVFAAWSSPLVDGTIFARVRRHSRSNVAH